MIIYLQFIDKGYLEKLDILVKIKACDKIYHRHIIDIPRINFLSITPRLGKMAIFQSGLKSVLPSAEDRRLLTVSVPMFIPRC